MKNLKSAVDQQVTVVPAGRPPAMFGFRKTSVRVIPCQPSAAANRRMSDEWSKGGIIRSWA
jgi:hypothetical protein